MDQRLREEVAAWLEFYRELGIEDFYRREPGSVESLELGSTAEKRRPVHPTGDVPPGPEAQARQPDSQAPSRAASAPGAAQRPPVPTPQAPRPEPRAMPKTPAHALNLFEAPPPSPRGRETLEEVQADLGDCHRCKLAGGRKHIVFGQGNPRAQVVFVGEGPGADEDEQGLPFVGRAGQLLNRTLQFVGIKREDVYICNVVKCRPPGNRTPEPDEVATCSPFLFRQLEAIQPRLICCLGAPAVKTVLGLKEGILKIRGRFYDYGSAKALATVHPAYVLRNPREEKLLREDFEKIREFLKKPVA